MSLRWGLLGVAMTVLATGSDAAPAPAAAPSAKLPAGSPGATVQSSPSVPSRSASAPSKEENASTWKPLMSEEAWRARIWQTSASEPPVEGEPQDPDPFGFSMYHGRRPDPMGAQTLINGARMNVASLVVEDPPQQVAKYYLEALTQAGIGPLLRGPVESAPGVTYLSFRPARSKNLKTLTFVPHGGGCIILASVGNPERLLEDHSVLPMDFPLPPNAETPTAVQQLEPGSESHSAFFLVRGGTVQQVQTFYREELTHRGYTALSPEEGLPSTDNYQKGHSVLSLSIQSSSAPAVVAVGLVWFEQ